MLCWQVAPITETASRARFPTHPMRGLPYFRLCGVDADAAVAFIIQDMQVPLTNSASGPSIADEVHPPTAVARELAKKLDGYLCPLPDLPIVLQSTETRGQSVNEDCRASCRRTVGKHRVKRQVVTSHQRHRFGLTLTALSGKPAPRLP
jgi:hypothetical protein